MKKIGFIITLCCLTQAVPAQSFALQQLVLNLEKLSQLREILNSMYKGYEVVSTGYNRIRDIAHGNFDLHQAFLDRLLQVSPTVRKYRRIAEIVHDQHQLVTEGKKAFVQFGSAQGLTREELVYVKKVYDNLLKQSLKVLDELLLVTTSGQLRMSDDERLKAIDRLYSDIQDQVQFLRSFCRSTQVLLVQRKQEEAQIRLSKKVAGIE